MFSRTLLFLALFSLTVTSTTAEPVKLNCVSKYQEEKWTFSLTLDLKNEVALFGEEPIKFAAQTKDKVFVWAASVKLNEMLSLALEKESGRFWASVLPPDGKFFGRKGHCFQPL